MLELRSATGEHLIAMSTRALESLTAEQISQIEKHGTIVHADIHSIEDSAGGSVRCMLAEIHLPKN